MKLSIVIPLFNAGPFIRKCLTSCLVQDIPDDEYEIIVIDDGSTDNGPEEVQSVIDNNRNGVEIRMFSQDNSGLSVARNLGLLHSMGDYVWFVDSDDWIEENCLHSLLEEVDDSDLLAFGMRNIDPAGLIDSVFQYKKPGVWSGRDYILMLNEKLKMCAPLFLFNRSSLTTNKICFFPGIFHEDVEFTPRAVFMAHDIVVSEKVPYNRLVHPGSITQTVNSKRPLDLVTVMERLKVFRDDVAEDKDSFRSFNSIISNVAHMACSLAETIPVNDRGEFKSSVSRCRWLNKALLNSQHLKYKIEGVLLSIMPGRLFEIHHFLMKFKRIFR